MSKPKKPSTSTDAMLAEIFQSPEYQSALKERLISGTAKASEINLARSLGIFVPIQGEDTAAREAMRKMDRDTLRLLMDLIRMSSSKEATDLRVIQIGDLISLGYDRIVRAKIEAQERIDAGGWTPGKTTEPVETPTDDDLMPR